jgi:hypothetical protein
VRANRDGSGTICRCCVWERAGKSCCLLTDPSVPFTNNPPERDARTMKPRQMISGGFRSAGGANGLAAIGRFSPLPESRAGICSRP